MVSPISGSTAPLYPITHDDHSGYIVLSVYASFLVAFTFWTARLAARWRARGLKLDDVFLILAMLLSLAETICIQLAINAGLGKRNVRHNKVHVSALAKFYYASTLLNIASQSCSKISISVLFHKIKSFKVFSVVNITGLGFSAAWGIASFLASAFQCDLPQPWVLRPGKCVDLYALFLGVCITNILSEVCLIILPITFTRKIQTTQGVRAVVALSFVSRVVVIAPLIGAVVTMPKRVDSGNESWAYTIPTICLQVVMNMSILSACIPGLQHYLAQLRAGTTMPIIDPDYLEASLDFSRFGVRYRMRPGPSCEENKTPPVTNAVEQEDMENPKEPGDDANTIFVTKEVVQTFEPA